MPDIRQSRPSIAAQRIGQFGVIATAVLVTSTAGLLPYIDQPPGPAWLTWIILASAMAVVASLAGWLIVRLVDSIRNAVRRQRSSPSN
ncbi:MAG: hypothetical protein ACT4P0_05145 [Panacagrimonas sp.]